MISCLQGLFQSQCVALRRGGQARNAADVRQRHRRPGHGRVAQVDTIKSTLKPRGTICLKLKCDIMLSTSAFKFNLRHYTMVAAGLTSPLFPADELAVMGGFRYPNVRHLTHLMLLPC